MEEAIRRAGLLVLRLQETGRKLGEGSYGEVVEVKVEGSLYAGKRLHAFFTRGDVPPEETSAISKRFEEECLRLPRLKHPNIMQVVGVHFHPSNRQPTLVMELLHVSLSAHLKKHPDTPPHLKCSVLLDVARGLQYLHSLPPPLGPIVHRDLTANNVLLTSNMTAKIADLGQARIIDKNPAQLARSNPWTKCPGNVAHMPPEALLDTPTYDAALDVFSFGVVMLHTLTQEWPEPSAERVLGPGGYRLVKEVERRRRYLDKIDNPLLKPLVIQCLNDAAELRPSAGDLIGALDMIVRMQQTVQQKTKEVEALQERLSRAMARLQQEQEQKHLHLPTTQGQQNEQKNPKLLPVAEPSTAQSKVPESLHVKEQERLLHQCSEEMEEKRRREAGRRGVNHIYDTVNTPPSQRRGFSQRAQLYPQDPYQGHPWASQPGAPATATPSVPPRTYQDQPAQPGPQHLVYAGQPGAPPPPVSEGLEIGSPVQLAQDPSRTGVIRWTGYFSEIQGRIAGVELDEPMEGCGDGEWCGQRYFSCLPGRGFFCCAVNLRPDERVMSSYFRPQGAGPPGNPLVEFPEWEEQDHNVADGQITKYLGEKRGIQGHQNSCYVDATVFGLFALSDVFDSLFLESGLKSDPGRIQRDISEMLWYGIVNPLRKNGAVRFESVMKLRIKLDELGKMEEVTTDEKDPEEFLNMLFKHTLHVEPFIQIKRPFGMEPEFFVQLFVAFDESLKTPTVEKLLQKMFKEQQISFAHVPSKLLVQVPRYGQQFKWYKRIIPGLKLDPAPLLDCPYQCKMCGRPAWNGCAECKVDFPKGDNDAVYLCDTCSERVHSHKDQAHHYPWKCGEVAEAAGELELLSVICIETSHYVCFARDSEEKWVFSDSMADRLYDTYNIPRGVDCTAQLNEWVYSSNTERLMAAGPRELPELVRRFTQDVYMCVYIQPDYGMYG